METVHYLHSFMNMPLEKIEASIEAKAVYPTRRLRSLEACRTRGELKHIYQLIQNWDRLR
jgi:hypothetical protein